MPKINLVKKNPINEETLLEHKEELKQLRIALTTLRADMDAQILEQQGDEELKKKFATYISYNPKDQKRLNTVIKDVNLIKKQITLSKLSPILLKLNDLEERIEYYENENNTE